MADKALVVGWDGATFDLLEPWVADGELPNLARLMQGGAHGRVKSVPNMNSGPAWTSVSTGLNPGKHGVYGLVDLAPGSYRIRPLNAADRHGKTIWQRLGEAGKQVVVMNLPLTWPADEVNGVLVAGGDAPSSHTPGFTYPEGLMREIDAEAGEYLLAARLDGLIRAGKRAEALSRIHRMVEGRTRAALYLMKRRPWDLFLVLFTASDVVQHFFWRDLAGGPYQDAILQVFRQLDSALGRLLAQAGDQTTVLVLSDHGFGPTQPGVYYLNDFLAGLELLRYGPQSNSRAGLLRWAFLQLERRLGSRMKEWLFERFPRLYEKAVTGLWMDNVDWPATQAFSLAGSNQIWINVRGRHPQGIVSPGEEYDAVMTLIQRALEGAVDPGADRPAVEKVCRQRDLYHGPFLDQAPDLLVRWGDSPVQSGLAWEGDSHRVIARRRTAHRRHPVNGSHREMGILVAHGPPFRSGVTIDGATLYDITPTLLYLLGQPIPRGLDGGILTSALTEQWLQSHPPQPCHQDGDRAPSRPVAISAEEEEEVMARLRSLGYIE